MRLLLFPVLLIASFGAFCQSSYQWKNLKTLNKDSAKENFWKVAVDSNDNKWVLSDLGLYKINPSDSVVVSFDFDNYPNGPTPGCQELIIDKNNNLWVAGYFLCFFDGHNWTLFDPSTHGFPSGKILDIEVDTSNVLWFSVLNNGLVKYDGVNFINYTAQNSTLISSKIIDMGFDKNGVLWAVSSEKAISFFKDNSWTNYTEMAPGLPFPPMSCINFDKDNNPVIGTFLNGFIIADANRTFKNIKPNVDSSWSVISGLYRDLYETIWAISSQGNLIQYKNNRWTNPYANSFIETNYARTGSLTGDKTERLWITSLDSGLFILEHTDTAETVMGINPGFANGKEELRIHPNPSTGKHIFIDITGNTDPEISVSALDINGRLIKTSTYDNAASHSLSFDVSGIQAGTYIILLNSKSQYLTKKLIIIN